MNNTVLNTSTITAPFNIPLIYKNNTRIITIASLFILLVSLVAILYPAVVLGKTVIAVIATVAILFALYWLYCAFANKPVFGYLNILLLLVAVFWFSRGGALNIFIGLALVFIAVFENRLKRPHLATISSTGITLQTSFNNNFEWAQLSNVIIKDGLLTIDTKSNRIFQKELAADITALQEAEINEFCAGKLNAKS